jgi:hypothetical protein
LMRAAASSLETEAADWIVHYSDGRLCGDGGGCAWRGPCRLGLSMGCQCHYR